MQSFNKVVFSEGSECVQIRKMNKIVSIFFMSFVTSLLLLLLISIEDAKAIDIGVIGGATVHSSYENDELTVGIQGGQALGLEMGNHLYPQVQLPDSLGHILEHPDIQEHIKLEYRLPAPILGFIPIRDTISGRDLLIDTHSHIISADIKNNFNLRLIGIYQFNFVIDIGGLNIRIPDGDYDFTVVVGNGGLDIDLLTLSGRKTSLSFGYIPDGYVEPGEMPEPGGNHIDSDETEVSVAFLPPIDKAPGVLDPENPTEPLENPDDKPTNDSGALTLDLVPSISFPQQVVAHETFNVQTDKQKPFVQISDRRNTDEGWMITAQMSHFRNVDTNSDSLLGATITFEGGKPSSPITSTEEPIVNQHIELVSGGEADTVMYAIPGSGSGTWLTRWYDTDENEKTQGNVFLTVPQGSAQVGDQEATITWTIQDVPKESYN